MGIILRSREEQLASLRASQECQAVRRLYTVASKFRDTLVAVQRDALSAISDRPAFEQIKKAAAEEAMKITESCAEDARTAGVEEDLEMLRVATSDALLDLPFPQELAIGNQGTRQRAVDLGMQALGGFLSGRDPMKQVQDDVEAEIRNRIWDFKIDMASGGIGMPLSCKVPLTGCRMHFSAPCS